MRFLFNLTFKPILGLLIFMASHVIFAHAQNFVAEGFSYAPGALSSTNNWRVFGASPAVNPIMVSKGNLNYPGGLLSNIGNKVELANIGQSVFQSFPSIAVDVNKSLYTSLVVNLSTAMPAGDFFYSLGTSSLPATTHGFKLYIKANGAGYSFGVLRGIGGDPVYETEIRPFNTNILVVLKYEFVIGTNNDIVKLYVNPELSHEPTIPTVTYDATVGNDLASFTAMALVQGDVLRAPTLAVDAVCVGNSWKSVTAPVFDYGDAPESYDTSKEAVFIPAAHKVLPEFKLGKILPDVELKPHSVLPGADNNGSNGDGAEEDAFKPAEHPIRKGVPYSFEVTISNPSATAKYLYAWIDFNNDGKFQAEELADIIGTVTTIGQGNIKLIWSAAKTTNIDVDATKLYMRLRLTDRILYDFTTILAGGTLQDERSIGNGATGTNNAIDHVAAVHGEVEDYQLTVLQTFDYGDLPLSYELDMDGNYLPAVHAPYEGFSIGKRIDLEVKPASVGVGNENNESGDNALGDKDEDGLVIRESVSPGAEYKLTIPVNVPASLVGQKYLYAWLDLNGDGKFQVNELATVKSDLTGEFMMELNWTAAQTSLIDKQVEQIYLRLRLSNLSLFDFAVTNAGGSLIDERSIGNGATSASIVANSFAVAFGEVEDYRLPVSRYDFGDVPLSYESNAKGVPVPARQIANSTMTIGEIIDDERSAHNVLINSDNNGLNGDGVDEDGLLILPIVTKGTSFRFSVPVRINEVASIIAWVDFNNNGKFEAQEVSYVNNVDAKNGYQLLPEGSSYVTFWFRGDQTRLIPTGATHLYVRIRLAKNPGTDNAQTADVDERAIADGVSTGEYTVSSFGEVEDYRFKIGPALYDFGDLPESYEMDKDGTANPLNYRPARNLPTEVLHLGHTYSLELAPHKVLPGANNNAENGDGLSDDGLGATQLLLQAAAVNTFKIAVTNRSDGAALLYAWIDFNNNGRFEVSEMATVSVPVGSDAVDINFTATQLNTLPIHSKKVYMRLRLIKPDFNVNIADYTVVASNGNVVDERAIADGLITGAYGAVSFGEIEDYQLTVIRDYGDLPESYENGSPASHTNKIIPELMLGETIDYELTNQAVLPDADNNGLNGDGLDEDAIFEQHTITDATPFKVILPVKTTLTGTKYLYGWIDYNGDGIFSADEGAYVNASMTIGQKAELVLSWPARAIPTAVLAAGKTYVRFRISSIALTNTNAANPNLIDTRSYGPSNAVGEVEDYQFLVSKELYDYGDAPRAYARSKENVYSPPRQVMSTMLRLGGTVDAEAEAHTVADGANNNGLNGDGLDEDGIGTIIPAYKGTAYYAQVSVYNNTRAIRMLHGWIDFNNDGYFEAAESVSLSIPSSNEQQKVILKWNAVQTAKIPVDVHQLYMRLRISEGNLTDLNSGGSSAILDERSIADGFDTGLYTTAYIGEVEDYVVPVIVKYDYGDAPDSYDMSRNNLLYPARQAVSEALYLGDKPADFEDSKNTQEGNAYGDDQTGEDDEGGMKISSIHASGNGAYMLNVKVTNNTGAARILHGWIDFNNNGRYELSESTTVSIPNGTNHGTYVLNWTAAAMKLPANINKLFMRLRISEGVLTDFSSGVPGALVDERSLADGLNTGEYGAAPIIFVGEVEDHVIPVIQGYDFGDVPVTYENNNAGVSVPARHIPTAGILLGDTIDTELVPHSVAPGMNNTGLNGDGLDEDGIMGPLPMLVRGSAYSLKVKVTNNLTANATLHAWIDMNADGRFSANEYTSLQVPANTGTETVDLNWDMATYTGLAQNTYMRLRLSTATFVDDIRTVDVDERSIADGLATGAYGTYPINGEVEDYFVPIDMTPAFPQDCEPSDSRLGLLSPIKALYHASIVKTANGEFLVFGSAANGAGTQQSTPAKLMSGTNGFEFTGNPIMMTGFSHQYFLLTTTGLFTWGIGYGGNVFSASAKMSQVPLPPGVGPAQVQFMDAGNSNNDGAIAILTKAGDIWIQSNRAGLHVHGDGNLSKIDWHKVMLDAHTSLTGMKDVRIVGDAAIATDGFNFYTWGNKVSLGNGSPIISKGYATLMQNPMGIKLPIMQQEISCSSQQSVSYYLRDGDGKVFVLGGNLRGQLGLGHALDMSQWTTISFMNEQPEAPGIQPDVTKPIKKVIWISASNSDGLYPHFSLITEENRNYTVASNASGGYGSIGGAPSATNIYLPTAVTMNAGANMLTGKMIYAATGGHISILIKDKSDRYGYVGHTIEGSDGCNGCTRSPNEFNFTLPPSTGPVCGNTAYDYGDLDERYNLDDQASHQIKYSQLDNPLKLGTNAADSDDEPQFTVSGSANNADGDDFDGKGGLIDEDAFISGQMPVKTAGSPYDLKVPLTNNTGKMAYLYGFIDWNNDGVFSTAEAVVKEVPFSPTEQEIVLSWDDVGEVADCSNELIRSFVRLRLTTDLLLDDVATVVDERSHLKASDGEVEDYYIDWLCPEILYCYLPGAEEGEVLESYVGITSQQLNVAYPNEIWPLTGKGAWLVLESKTKGFVLNRVPFTATGVPVGIPPDHFVDGMLVYDSTNNCLKLYTSADNGITYKWFDINQQSCPK